METYPGAQSPPPSRNKMSVIAVKNYAKLDLKVFSSSQIFPDLFFCVINFFRDCRFDYLMYFVSRTEHFHLAPKNTGILEKIEKLRQFTWEPCSHKCLTQCSYIIFASKNYHMYYMLLKVH